MCHMSCVTCHVSLVTCHVTHVTYYMVHVACHMSLTPTATAVDLLSANSSTMACLWRPKTTKSMFFFFCLWGNFSHLLSKTHLMLIFSQSNIFAIGCGVKKTSVNGEKTVIKQINCVTMHFFALKWLLLLKRSCNFDV